MRYSSTLEIIDHDFMTDSSAMEGPLRRDAEDRPWRRWRSYQSCCVEERRRSLLCLHLRATSASQWYGEGHGAAPGSPSVPRVQHCDERLYGPKQYRWLLRPVGGIARKPRDRRSAAARSSGRWRSPYQPSAAWAAQPRAAPWYPRA